MVGLASFFVYNNLFFVSVGIVAVFVAGEVGLVFVGESL
jgi:hypothetical protein